MNELHITYASTPQLRSSNNTMIRTISIMLLIASVAASVVYINAKRRKAHNREE